MPIPTSPRVVFPSAENVLGAKETEETIKDLFGGLVDLIAGGK